MCNLFGATTVSRWCRATELKEVMKWQEAQHSKEGELEGGIAKKVQLRVGKSVRVGTRHESESVSNEAIGEERDVRMEKFT